MQMDKMNSVLNDRFLALTTRATFYGCAALFGPQIIHYYCMSVLVIFGIIKGEVNDYQSQS